MSPIPGMIDQPDGYFYIKAEWRLCWAFWPHRCNITGRRIWPGTLAYRGRAVYTGPGEPAIEYKWHDKNEHLIWQLKE